MSDVSDEGLNTLANAVRSQALVHLQYLVDLSAGESALKRLAIQRRGSPQAALYAAAHRIVEKELGEFIDGFVGNLDNEKKWRAELAERKSGMVRRDTSEPQGGIQDAISRALGNAKGNSGSDSTGDSQSPITQGT